MVKNGRVESQMSVGGTNILPKLSNAECEDIETYKEYKSGASYEGHLEGNFKAGYGTFTWPNGAQYKGEFVNNVRHGKGLQRWPDGSQYEGDFSNDLRHGEGEHSWSSGEIYSGSFFKDRRHGAGTYTWPNGASYKGMFYIDKKEGYGTFNFANGSKFDGLYKEDEREGPGVLTNADKTQDVGLWHRENLVKLCSGVSDAFTMKEHKEFDYNVEENKMYIRPVYNSNRMDVVDPIVKPPEQFDYEPEQSFITQANTLFSGILCSSSLAMDIEIFDEVFFKDVLEKNRNKVNQQKQKQNTIKNSKGVSSGKGCSQGSSAKSDASSRGISTPHDSQRSTSPVSRTATSVKTSSMPNSRTGSVVTKDNSKSAVSSKPMSSEVTELHLEDPVAAWNNTPSFISMQRHVLKHDGFATGASVNVEAILKGDRTQFGGQGPIEKASESFLLAAASGNAALVASMLHNGEVFVDVCDKTGHTALIAAAVNWHKDVINCLLDNGTDVNRLNDEGVSALAACHVHFYPVCSFLYNTAERYMEKPPDFEQEPGYDVNEAVKGILSTSQKKRSQSPERKANQLDSKKIQKFREEYGGKDTKENAEAEIESNCDIDIDEKRKKNDENERKLGTLKVKRAVRINIDDVMDPEKEKYPDPVFEEGNRASSWNSDEGSDDGTALDEFESHRTVENYQIQVTDHMIDRCATQLSTNDMVVGRSRSAGSCIESLGTVRRLAIDKSMHELMESTIRLLLKRGADPNASNVPMPVLFFAIKAGDVEAVKLLLMKGASTTARMSEEKGGLAPLHIAVAIPGEEGVQITQLLLDALADPDARALQDDSFLNKNLEEEWKKDSISEEASQLLGGRTPLLIACSRDDNYKNACRVVHLLLDHHARTDLLCNGYSPLALAITSGNDGAIDELLAYGADPCLPLTHGAGSALCVASSTEYEHRRTPTGRIQLIDKLIRADADILAPIPIGPKRVTGTAVDYAYYMYNLDRRIAHMPYHALTHAERETYNARRKLLAHLGDIMRVKAVERERRRLEEEERAGSRSHSPSSSFVYTGAGASLPPGMKARGGRAVQASDSRVSFGAQTSASGDIRKPLFRYCYECGRSVGVRLSACTRCKEVHYCSKACKLKAWNARHKEECVRVGGRSPSPRGKDKRIDSPTPANDPDKGKPTTVPGIMAGDRKTKLPEILDQSPNIFMTGGQGKSGGKNNKQNRHARNESNQTNTAHIKGSKLNPARDSKHFNNSKDDKNIGDFSNSDHLHGKGQMFGRSKGGAKGKTQPSKPKWVLDAPANAIIDNYSFE